MMVKRFLVAFALLTLYIALWAGLLYGVTLLAQEDEGLLLTAVLAAMAFLILAFVPFLDQVVKRSFHFAAASSPIAADQLRRQILSVNRYRAPVMAEERLYDLVLTWKYVDIRWWEQLAKAGLNRLYELHIKLDEKRSIATLIDVYRTVDWRTGPAQVQVGSARGLVGGMSRTVVFRHQIGEQWGIEENWAGKVAYDLEFVPTEIKTPVMNTLMRSGWSVRFGIW
jgi:hypothetical protein